MATIDLCRDSRVNTKSKAFAKLAQHPACDEIENYGCDEGRFFIHTKRGFSLDIDACPRHSTTVGGALEALKLLDACYPCDCQDCGGTNSTL